MSHYYEPSQKDVKSNPKKITYTFRSNTFEFTTDHGIFSKDHVDDATHLLLESIQLKSNQKVLDLGCGYGVIGIVLNIIHGAQVTMVDINQRALDYAQGNVIDNHSTASVINSDGFSAIEEETFDIIISNPPIRIGKQKMYAMFLQAKAHLNNHGALWLVMHKKHGALSAMKYLEQHYNVHCVKKTKGWHIIECRKALTD